MCSNDYRVETWLHVTVLHASVCIVWITPDVCIHTHHIHSHTYHTHSLSHTQFYLQLYYHSKGTQSLKDNDRDGTSQPLSPLPDIDTLCVLRQQDPEFASSEGAAFDTVIEVFSSLARDMEATLEQRVISTVQAKCKKYKKEKYVLEHPRLLC